MEIPLLSVTHGQCDARPTVTFPACAGTKLTLVGDRGTRARLSRSKAVMATRTRQSKNLTILSSSRETVVN